MGAPSIRIEHYSENFDASKAEIRDAILQNDNQPAARCDSAVAMLAVIGGVKTR